MIFGIDPTFTAKEVKDIIISTATGSYGSVKEQYPLLNARLAVEKAIKLSNEKAKGQTGDDLPFEPSGEHQYRIFHFSGHMATQLSPATTLLELLGSPSPQFSYSHGSPVTQHHCPSVFL